MNYFIIFVIILFIYLYSKNENYKQPIKKNKNKNSNFLKKNKKIRNLSLSGDQCGMKTENECYASNECGYCLHEKGFGVCLDGNENEPYDYNSCWKYNFKKFI